MVIEQAEQIAANVDAERNITWALKDLAGRAAGYAAFTRYYEGDQSAQFITAKLRKAFGNKIDQGDAVDNFCASVVDAIADRLQVTGFVTEGADPDTDPMREATAKIWARNRMDRRAGEVHNEALTTGDAYVIVDTDAEGRAVFWPQSASKCTVKYSTDAPDLIERAAKVWLDEDAKRWRVTLYYPDRIEKYEAPASDTKAWPKDGKAFHLVDGQSVVPTVGGIVPVFHFGNNARTNAFGRSELKDVVPLQNGLNKTNARMEVAEEFFAVPQRWAIGWEPEIDETTGKPKPTQMNPMDILWSAGGDGENRPAFGEFAASSPEGLLKSSLEKKADIARVSKTPMHILMLSSDQAPSGEALKTAESPFVKKVRDRQRDFGSDWAEAMALALAIEGTAGAVLETTWEDPAPRSEVDVWSVALLMKQLGVALTTILRKMGWTEQEIEENAGAISEQVEAAQAAFSAGAGVPMGRVVAGEGE